MAMDDPLNEDNPRSTATVVPTGAAMRAGQEVARLVGEPLPAGLYLVATPIGHLADITLRALAVLTRCDVIYCEDTRHSRTLTGHYGITTHLNAYHEHNGERERPKILAQLAQGRRVALISDAGTPLISDPGYKLVREALAAGHRVESLPGPSAALTALTVSGLPTDAFLFAGFLPVKSAGRRARANELRAVPATLIFFEAPTRVAEALADLAVVLGARPAAVARELTKRFETVVRGTLNEVALAFAESDARGEYVILVGPPMDLIVDDGAILEHLALALETLSLRDAAKVVADQLSISKSRVYDLGLKKRAE